MSWLLATAGLAVFAYLGYALRCGGSFGFRDAVTMQQAISAGARPNLDTLLRELRPMRFILIGLAAGTLLSGCASDPSPSGVNAAIGQRIADMPHWMGGLPEGVPPRPGAPGYEEWQAKRDAEAKRPKTKDEPARSIPTAPAEGN